MKKKEGVIVGSVPLFLQEDKLEDTRRLKH